MTRVTKTLLIILIEIIISGMQIKYTSKDSFLVKTNLELTIEDSENKKAIGIKISKDIPTTKILSEIATIQCSTNFIKNTDNFIPSLHSCDILPSETNLVSISYKNGLIDKIFFDKLEQKKTHNFKIIEKSIDFLSALHLIMQSIQNNMRHIFIQAIQANGVDVYNCINNIEQKKSTKCKCSTIFLIPQMQIVSENCGSIKIDFNNDYVPTNIEIQNKDINYNFSENKTK